MPGSSHLSMLVAAALLVACGHADSGSTTSPPDAATDSAALPLPGTMKLFFTANPSGPPADAGFPLLSATSANGIDFTLDQDTWRNDMTMGDPVVYPGSRGRWLYAGYSTKDHGVYIRHNDGTPDFNSSSFDAFIAGAEFPGIIETDAGFRVYYGCPGGICSAFSPDGVKWTEESGLRVSPPTGSVLALTADPAPARRKDGTYVLYVKAATPPSSPNPTPYDHMIYRATSKDALTFTFEDVMLINHASVPQAYTDANGRVWVYYLDFTRFPGERESIAAVYEQDDYSLSAPRTIKFDKLPHNTWANDPTPVRIP